jgi:NADH:ubiquinone oxidoreductase subunit E
MQIKQEDKFMKVTVCIGSSCHLKGSRQIVEQLQNLVAEKFLKDKIELCGAFCMGNCTNGVCIKVDDEMFSLQPENTRSFFENEILSRL